MGFFHLIVFAVTIVMLNVLITIVSEGYGLAQANRIELSRRHRASTIVDIENVFLRPCSRRAVRRGKPCVLIRYPMLLLRLAGVDRGTDGSPVLRVQWPCERDSSDDS